MVESPPQAAIHAGTGRFKSTARSLWLQDSDEPPDGDEVSAGGIVAKLPASGQRKIYTDVQLLEGSLSRRPVNRYNGLINGRMLGGTDDNWNANINWARGLNASGTEQREQIIGDPLHSAPAAMTYDCRFTLVDGVSRKYNVAGNPGSGCAGETLTKIFFGTNQGFIHGIDTLNGQEDFAFIPEALLKNINHFRNNPKLSSSQKKIYGMDLTPTIWHKDKNNDKVVNGEDKVYLYAGMRRGGRNYYALDITDPTDPKKAWTIHGGLEVNSYFKELGYTWSKPVVAKMKVSKTVKNVLVFAGGYDPAQDDRTTRTYDGMGNALFIVDAETGALIWKASHKAGQLQLEKMIYSLPAEPSVVDINADGLADQIVIGDMGGQIWRFFINNGNPANNLVSPLSSDTTANRGVFASLAGDTAATARRFYNSPSVALSRHGDGKTYLTIAVGSGFRASPLSTAIEDRFYVLKTPHIYNQPNTEVAPLVESDLVDVTDNPVAEGTEQEKQAALKSLNLKEDKGDTEDQLDKGGWYIKLDRISGQKSLTKSLIFNNEVRFISYATDGVPTACQPVSGTNRYYRLNLFDGDGIRARRLAVPGISGDVALMVLDGNSIPNGDGSDGPGTIGVELGAPTDLNEPGVGDMFRRTFWMKE